VWWIGVDGMGWCGEEKSFAQVKKNLCSVLLFAEHTWYYFEFLKENILFMGHFRRTVFLFFYTLR